MARQYYKDSTTGQMKPIGVKVEDTLPVGTEVDYDGQDIPEGWVEVDDPNEYSTEETKIGTCMGKPLYRKMIKISDTSLTTPTPLLIGTIANIEDVINGNCNIKFKNGPWAFVPFNSMVNNVYNINNYQAYYVTIETNGRINLNPQFASSASSTQNLDKIIFVLEYTKTTD